MTANIVFSVFRPAHYAIGCAAGFFAVVTEIAALATGLPPGFKAVPQNQKRGFLAALERSGAYKSRVRQSQSI
jgi:hypothetical protein